MMDGVEELGFERFVDEYFAYLGSKFGFTKRSSNPHVVQFDGSDRYVKVIHGRYEIDLAVGVANTTTEVSVNDIIKYEFDTRGNLAAWNWDASDRQSVERGVSRLARLFYEIGKESLNGDVQYLHDVDTRSAELRQQAMRKQELEEIEQKALKAWANHQYNLVISLYGPIESELNDTQKKRLQLAKLKISGGA